MNQTARRLHLLPATLVVLLVVTISVGAQVQPQLFDGLRWRLIGPFRGGRVVAVTGVPGDPNTFYFGSVDGGVWKTTNAGWTWQPIFDSQPVGSIGAIAVAPSRTGVIYVGTGESDIRSDLASGNGVYKSTDAGRTWQSVGLSESRQVSRIVVDPTNPDIVYVGVLGHAYAPNDERGVYKSTDGGKTWKRVLDKGPEIGISDLAMARNRPQLLFAGTWNARRPPWSTYAPLQGPGSGVYRSTDSGGTWTELKGNGLPEGKWGRVGVAVDGKGQRVYALIDAGKNSGLYRSDDGGDHWTRANGDPRLTSRAWYFNWLTLDPSNPDVVYVPNVAVYRSEDGGKTISILRGAPGGDDYHDLWVDPGNPSRMILGVDQGTSISVDRGDTWSSWYNQPTAQMYHVITNNEFPYIVYGAQQDSGAAGVPNRTDHGKITARDWFLIGGGESGYVAPDPQDPNIIYASGVYGSVVRYDRRTSLSQDITPWPLPNFGSEINGRKYRDAWTPMLVFSPSEKNSLLMGTQYVMKTTDGGLHWQQISPDLTGTEPNAARTTNSEQGGKKPEQVTVDNAEQLGFGVVYSIAASPLDPKMIWAGSDSGLVHVTRDGGQTWTNVTPPGLSAWSKITMIEASRFDAGVAYAAVDRHRLDDEKPYLYRTHDYGKTWQLITTGIGDHSFLNAIREDTQNRSLLFAGTEFGVYVSFDAGDHWQPLQLNLPVSSIRDFSIHGDDLVVGTHGRSFWILDDITPLRQVSEKSSTSTAMLYQPATTIRVDNDSFLGTPLPPEEPQADNPPDGAVLDYYLPSGRSVATLEISDKDGKLIRRFSSTDKPQPKHPPLPIAERWFPEPVRLLSTEGMHRFVWDLRARNSGDSGDLDDEGYGVPRGPRVPPGAYNVKLILSGSESSSEPTQASLKVEMDPRSTATSSDLEQQFKVGQQMFSATILSRQALAEIGSVEKRLAEVKQQAAGKYPNVAQEIDSINKSMEQIEKGNSGSSGAMGLDAANTGLAAALRVVESSHRAIPGQAMEVYEQSQAAATSRISEWKQLKATKLSGLNDDLRKAGLQPISVSEIEEQVEYLMSR